MKFGLAKKIVTREGHEKYDHRLAFDADECCWLGLERLIKLDEVCTAFCVFFLAPAGRVHSYFSYVVASPN